MTRKVEIRAAKGINDLLHMLSRRFDSVQLTFTRVEHNGDCWWGVNCKKQDGWNQSSLSVGGRATPVEALREAVRQADTMKK